LNRDKIAEGNRNFPPEKPCFPSTFLLLIKTMEKNYNSEKSESQEKMGEKKNERRNPRREIEHDPSSTGKG
jgi:hypothetical protein